MIILKGDHKFVFNVLILEDLGGEVMVGNLSKIFVKQMFLLIGTKQGYIQKITERNTNAYLHFFAT